MTENSRSATFRSLGVPALLFLVALLLLLVLHQYNLWDMAEGWVIADEGHQVYQPLRWMAGQWVYRDFATDNYPPGSIWLHGLLFSLFGVKMSVMRVFLAGVGAGIAAMAYVVTRKLMPAGWAVIAYLLCLTWNVLNLNMGYPSWYCALLGLAVLPVIMRYTRTGNVRWLMLAGALAGVSLALKTTQGAFQWIGLAMFLAWRSAASRPGEHGVRRLLSWESGFAVVVVFLAGALLRSFPTPVNLLVFGAPILMASLAVIAGRPASEPSASQRPFVWELIWLGLGLGLVTVAWVAPTVAVVGWDLFIESTFLAPLRHSAFMYAAIRPPTINGWLLIAWALAGGLWFMRGEKRVPTASLLTFGALGAALLFLPIPFSFSPREWLRAGFQTWRDMRFYLTLLSGVVIWVLMWRQRVDSAHRPVLALLLMYSAWNFMQVYPFADSNHLLWSIQPAFIGLAYLCSRLWQAGSMRASGRTKWASALAVGLLPALCIALQVYPLAGHFFSLDRGVERVSYAMLDTERANIYVQEGVALELRKVKVAIESLTDDEDTIFDTSGPFFYFWTGRHNATKHDFLWPGFLTDGEVTQLVRDLETEEPALVIRRETDEHVCGYASFAETFPTVAEFIETQYQLEVTIGEYALWSPK